MVEEDQSLGDLQSASAVVLDTSLTKVQSAENITAPTVAMRVGQSAGKSGDFLDGVSGNSWGLSSGGPSSIDLEVKIKTSSWLPDPVSDCSESLTHVCVRGRAVILGDGWSSSDDGQARRRVRSLMPATVLEPVGNAVSVVGNLPLFQELKDLKGAFGHVDMTVLPEYLD